MVELMKDRKGAPIYVGDYVLFGVRCNSMGDAGEMRVGRVIDKTGHGIGVEGSSSRFKVSHKITKVDDEFALRFIHYTS